MNAFDANYMSQPTSGLLAETSVGAESTKDV